MYKFLWIRVQYFQWKFERDLRECLHDACDNTLKDSLLMNHVNHYLAIFLKHRKDSFILHYNLGMLSCQNTPLQENTQTKINKMEIFGNACYFKFQNEWTYSKLSTALDFFTWDPFLQLLTGIIGFIFGLYRPSFVSAKLHIFQWHNHNNIVANK